MESNPRIQQLTTRLEALKREANKVQADLTYLNQQINSIYVEIDELKDIDEINALSGD